MLRAPIWIMSAYSATRRRWCASIAPVTTGSPAPRRARGAAEPRPAHADHGARRPELPAHQLEGLEDAHDLLHAGGGLQGVAQQLLGVTVPDHPDEGALRAHGEVRVQPRVPDLLHDGLQLGLRGARFHDHDHGDLPSENKKAPVPRTRAHTSRGTTWLPGDSPGSQHVTPRGSIRVGSGTALPPLRGSTAPSRPRLRSIVYTETHGAPVLADLRQEAVPARVWKDQIRVHGHDRPLIRSRGGAHRPAQFQVALDPGDLLPIP